MSDIVFWLSGVAFAAGFIDSIAGGGGLLLTPSLLVAGVPPHVALGTNKFASTIGTSTALVNFIRGKMVLWRVAAFGVGFSLLGSFLGTKLVLSLSPEPVARLVALVLPFAVAATLMPKRDSAAVFDFKPLELHLKTPAICLAIGFYDGFLGPGTGSFLILAFHALLRIDLVRASATAKIFNFASNVSALAVFALAGTVDYALGLPLAAANVAGNYLGSHLAIRKGGGVVRGFLAVSLTILFATLVWKYFLS